MKKVSFRVRNFDKEQFLTYDIDNEATLDEEVLDFLEDDEPKGIVPIIYEEEEEFDTFSYNVTDKIRLRELSEQEINAEMVLKVMRGLILSLIDMGEYRVPLSYLVLHRNYVYINSDYEVEFICVPLENMQEDVDLNAFLRNLVASLRFDSSENGDYVAKLLSYINNTAIFNLRNMLTLVEELMEVMGVEVPEDSSTDIYVDYQEVLEDDDDEEEISIGENLVTPEENSEVEADVVEEEIIAETEEAVAEVDEAEEEAVVETDEAEEEAVAETDEVEEEAVAETDEVEEVDTEDLTEAKSIIEDLKKMVQEEKKAEAEELPNPVKKPSFKTKDTSDTGVIMDDDFDKFFAEREREEQEKKHEETGLKIRKNIKVNRASVAKSNHEEESDSENINSKVEVKDDKIDTPPVKEVVAPVRNTAVPKVNPYLIRVNTEERIMITKQNFKVGKASMGVDYTVKGNSAVSRVHAIIMSKEDIYYVKDNKSTNHTIVNGRILEEGESEQLSNGCKIILGDEEFIFKLG